MKLKWWIFIPSSMMVFVTLTFWLHHFLSFNQPVHSNNFLIESWISPYELEEVASTFGNDPLARYYVVGPNFQDDKDMHSRRFHELKRRPLRLYSNVSIVFDLKEIHHKTDTITLKIQAGGSTVREVSAHLVIAIDGKLVSSFFTRNELNEYEFQVPVNSKPEWLTLSFRNDLLTKNEDRNLRIEALDLNGYDVFNFPFTYSKEESLLFTGFTSRSGQTANYLIDLGIDESRIICVNFDKPHNNQTLAEADAFLQSTNSHQISSINIISSDIHCRRSFTTYHYLLGENVDVGVIYWKPIDFKRANWYKNPKEYLKVWEELISHMINYLQIRF
ncbi:MAG: hypothetical protein K9G76_08615 [Bacteroidales bacterium]|nr:hypothetical protein [Bacteroidales bacterium]MCF8404428.1 hypothetical protein [Bacteroidales bacterium]